MANMNFDYIAAFIDGEGCFPIANTKCHYHPRISISQNTKYVLEEIQMFLKRHSIKSTLYEEISKKRGNKWYNLRIQDRKSLSIFCDYLDGRMFVKSKQLLVLKRLLQIKCGHKTRGNDIEKINRIIESAKCRKEIMTLNQDRMV